MSDSAGDKPQTESATSYKKKSGKPMFIVVVVVALVVGLLLGTVIGSVFLQEEQKGGAIDRILDRGVLRVGTNVPWEPFEYFNETSGNYEGIDMGVVQYIADSLGVELEIVPLDFEALWGAVATGQIDIAISSITILEERKQTVDFSIPYYVANQAVLLRESLNVTTEDDLSGLKIGAQMGTTGAYYVEDNWEGGSIASYNSYPDLSAAILALNANTVNALVVDTPVAYRYANDTAYDYKVAFVIETNENYGIAIPKDNPGLKIVIDNILEELLSSGEMDDIIAQYT